MTPHHHLGCSRDVGAAGVRWQRRRWRRVPRLGNAVGAGYSGAGIWATTTVKTWRPNAVQELSEQEVKEYATRYKWLRDASNNQKERILSKTADCWGIYLDQAIDKAMKEEADESSNKIQNQ